MAFLIPNHSISQEWKSLAKYKVETNKQKICSGCWLKKDRKRSTKVWQEANKYNLTLSSKVAVNKYRTISERRDFYKWFDMERKKIGHDIQWTGVAAIVAGQFAHLDSWFIRTFIILDSNVINFANEGNKAIFDDVYPFLQNVYFGDTLIKGNGAINWDSTYIDREQCKVVEPIYQKQKLQTLCKISNMAKGKGFFSFGVPYRIRFQGNVMDCLIRRKHGIYRLIPYYEYKTRKNKQAF